MAQVLINFLPRSMPRACREPVYTRPHKPQFRSVAQLVAWHANSLWTNGAELSEAELGRAQRHNHRAINITLAPGRALYIAPTALYVQPPYRANSK
jgi:hypothetical protein